MTFTYIFKNIIGYDGLIIILAGVNGYIAYQLRKQILTLGEILNPTVYMPIDKIFFKIKKEHSLDLHYIRNLKDQETKLAHLFSSLTTIFPLMGILGTILSLIRIITLEDTALLLNFSTALTSTFWGLVFAILFKALGGVLFGKAESNDEMLKLLFSRIDQFESPKEVE